MLLNDKTICFTGFSKNEKSLLCNIAHDAGLLVKNDVLEGLSFLCCGENAGPSKINKAQDYGATLVSRDGFETMIAGGEPKEVHLSSKLAVKSKPDPAPKPQFEVSVHDEHPMLDFLWRAIEMRKHVDIIYHRGSHSGSLRTVVPLSLEDRLLLKAVDLSTDNKAVKSFAIEFIEIDGMERLIVSPSNCVREKNRNHKKYVARQYQSIEGVYSALKETIEGMGWLVIANKIDDEFVKIGLYGRFKNGNPRKKPIISLYYEHENKNRPYVCKCRKVEFTRTYTDLDKAAQQLLELAKQTHLMA